MIACSDGGFTGASKKETASENNTAKPGDDDDDDDSGSSAKPSKPSTTVRDPAKGFPSPDAKTLYVPLGGTVALPPSAKDCKGGDAVASVKGADVKGEKAGKVELSCDDAKKIDVVVYDPKNPPAEVVSLSTLDKTTSANNVVDVVDDATTSSDLTIVNDELDPILKKLKGTVVFADWLQSTPEGTKKVGGLPCPEGYETTGSLGECSGNGTVSCFGNLVFCRKATTLELDPKVSVLTDLTMTPQNTHIVGGIACPAPSVQVGGVPDCGGGKCFGNQLICATRKNLDELTPGAKIITNFAMTAENAHLDAPVCPAGSEPIGSVADCGGASGTDGAIRGCQGSQLFCVTRLPLE